MAPVDGKIDNSRWSTLAKEYDQTILSKQYHSIAERFNTDAWLFGTNTVKEFFPEHFDGCACHVAFPDQLRTFVGECSSKRMMVALVPEGDVRFTSNKLRGDNIIVVLGEKVSADYLEFLEDMQISYVFAGREGTDLKKAMENICHDFDIYRLSVQGGGITNGGFFQAGLVNELSVIISPQIDGNAGSISIINYPGDDREWTKNTQLRLIASERLEEDCVWLHYEVKNSEKQKS